MVMTWNFDAIREETSPGFAAFLSAFHEHEAFFDPREPLWLARAPGRLDLMGGIADYSGSLVLELPLALATWVAIQPCLEKTVTLRSTIPTSGNEEAEVTFPLAALDLQDYATAYTFLTANSAQAWCAYVIGALLVLKQERPFALDSGLRLLIHSDVPPGKGVSSSAALEVATMQALCGLYQLQVTGRDLAIFCQRAENLIVGAPCGIMDQMTSACGQQDSLLALLCQPAELQEAVTLPKEVEVWGIDSGIRHAVTGADYGSVRVGAFMGYRIIADLAGLPVHAESQGRVSIEDSLWNGYLANIPPSLWEQRFQQHVPVQMSGADFLDRYAGFTDSVTSIQPERVYAVRQPTAHPIYEHQRVRLFRNLLAEGRMDEERLRLLGELMFQSHASYSACGLGSSGTDRLVELIRQAEPGAQLYGAKITGGGSGGTVAVLTGRGTHTQIERIARVYSQETGLQVEVLGGSSPGAVAWQCHQILVE